MFAGNHFLFAQGPTNTDPNKGFVNVNIPKAPESAAFERYGNTQVSEFTGTTNISIPIYNLKSRFLESPIAISYQSNPVRVNQEASWVGLGFDLNAGGRITVETRGAIDFCNLSYFLGSQTTLASGMSQIFSRLGNSGENSIFTPATFCEPNIGNCPDPNFYNGQAISDMTQFGLGEPDIFRANFLGHSLTFYVDKISGDIKFIGEKSFCFITYTVDAHNITKWSIKDTEGNTYLFEQAETTTNTLTGSPVVPSTSTSAWLLTKVLHPTGDYIQYSYTNFGPVVPAFTMNTSIDYEINTATTTAASETYQNINIQNTYYLTRMETSTVAVDFVLDTRTDLYGLGSRKLSQVKVTDKLTNTVKKTCTFNYSYFQASINASSRTYLNSLFYSLPNNMDQLEYLKTSNSRLKLNSVTISNGTSAQTPYTFTYNENAIDKYSLSQDHWGYNNGVANGTNGYGFTHLIPYTLLGNSYIFNQGFLNGIGGGSLIGFNRECDGNAMQAMMLTEIGYPTGGRTEFTYEPHQSTMAPTTAITGGGLRVKTIKNYIGTQLVGTKEYSYSGGKYMGAIKYLTSESPLGACNSSPQSPHLKLTTSGAVNANDMLVGYSQISVIEKDNAGQPNGSVVKTFNTVTASSNYSNNGAGVDIAPPYLSPNETVPPYISPWIPQNYALWLDMSNKLFPPTPSMNLEGKLMGEKYYDNSNTLLKSVDYTYHLANYTNNFYDVKAIQNRDGGFNYPSCSGGPNGGAGSGGLRPVNLFVSPAKSFNAQMDSKVETTYSNGNTLTNTSTYTYDSFNQLKTSQTTSSDGTNKTITYSYPNDNLPAYVFLMAAHKYSTIISTTETHNGNTANVVKSNYFQPSTGVFVPQSVQEQIAGNPIETRENYNAYDAYGNLLEKQKPNGIKETFLWGYDKQYPVATVTGADYATASGLVDLSVLNAPASDDALRTELNKIRTGLPNALVTSYTYDNVYGLTSITDPRGRITYYNYDGLGRLALIKDHDNNILKKICYNYAGQPENCTICTNFSPIWQNTTTPLRCQLDATGQNTGYQEQEQVNVNTCSNTPPLYNDKRWVQVAQNPTACPLPVYVNLTSTNTNSAPGFTASYYNTTTGFTYNFAISTASGLQTLGTVPAGNYTLTIAKPGSNMSMTFKSGCFKQTIVGTSATFFNVGVSTSTCNSITISNNVE
ncbi:hypothetical protein GCM10027043_48290 [Ferruginibacter profundus]